MLQALRISLGPDQGHHDRLLSPLDHCGKIGSSFTTRSTHKGDIHVEICSACHPFFTGKQKLIDTAGRVERFRRKYAKAEAPAAK